MLEFRTGCLAVCCNLETSMTNLRMEFESKFYFCHTLESIVFNSHMILAYSAGLLVWLFGEKWQNQLPTPTISHLL